MTKHFTDVQKGQLFKALASKSQYKVGVDFGLDKLSNNPQKIINIVNTIYREVKENPNAFAISQEVLDLVEGGMSERRQKKHEYIDIPPDPTKIDERSLVIGVKAKVWALLDRKLNYLIRNRKAFKAESILALAKIASIAFDKAQIMRGEATEHIAMKSQISKDITSDQATMELLSIRERLAAKEE